MRALLQRVSHASVSVEGETVGKTGEGFLILLGVMQGDTGAQAILLAEKTALLRVFEDEAGKMNRSLLDIGGEALVVSQFTLCADTRKGRRPSFTHSAPPQEAKRLYEAYVQALRGLGVARGNGRVRRPYGGVSSQPRSGDDPAGYRGVGPKLSGMRRRKLK